MTELMRSPNSAVNPPACTSTVLRMPGSSRLVGLSSSLRWNGSYSGKPSSVTSVSLLAPPRMYASPDTPLLAAAGRRCTAFSESSASLGSWRISSCVKTVWVSGISADSE